MLEDDVLHVKTRIRPQLPPNENVVGLSERENTYIHVNTAHITVAAMCCTTLCLYLDFPPLFFLGGTRLPFAPSLVLFCLFALNVSGVRCLL